MTHNPIVKRGRCGRSQPRVGLTQKGILSQGGKYESVEPGQRFSYRKLWKYRDWELIIVDVASHHWSWQPTFDSSDDGHPFKLELDLRYHVNEPEKVVRNNVLDLENALARDLSPKLSEIAEKHPLSAYKQVAKEMTSAIKAAEGFEKLGLKLGSDLSVMPRLSDEDQRFVNEKNELERARMMPRQQRFTGQLPSAQPSRGFSVRASVQYLLTEVNRISTIDELEMAARNMWDPNIMKLMDRICRNYTFQQVVAAQDAVDRELASQTFNDYGIRVVNIATILDLDAASLAVAADDIAQQDILDKVLRNRITFLARMLAQGQLDMKAVLDYLDEKELKLPVEILEKLSRIKREGDMLDIDTAQEAARAIVNSVLKSTSAQSSVHQLDAIIDSMPVRAELSERVQGARQDKEVAEQ